MQCCFLIHLLSFDGILFGVQCVYHSEIDIAAANHDEQDKQTQQHKTLPPPHPLFHGRQRAAVFVGESVWGRLLCLPRYTGGSRGAPLWAPAWFSVLPPLLQRFEQQLRHILARQLFINTGVLCGVLEHDHAEGAGERQCFWLLLHQLLQADGIHATFPPSFHPDIAAAAAAAHRAFAVPVGRFDELHAGDGAQHIARRVVNVVVAPDIARSW